MSKEHLFSDWLRELFPRTPNDTHTFGKIHWTPEQRQETRTLNGHSGTRRVRKVCVKCNGGWLSQIDAAARNAAIPFITGATTTVTSDAQKAFGVWLSKIATVGDSLNGGRHESVVTQAHRTFFMENRRPPDTWEVYIGYYEGEIWRNLAINQHCGILDIPTVSGPITGYIEATAIGIGNLFAFVFGVESPDLQLSLAEHAACMRKIWPIGRDFSWPINPAITDAQAYRLAQILRTTRLVPIG